MTKRKESRKWKVDDLRPHPRQSELFRDLSEIELAFLAGDIKLNGLQQPLEITPDGTVIAGHQRLHRPKVEMERSRRCRSPRFRGGGAGCNPGATDRNELEPSSAQSIGNRALRKELVELEHSSDWQRRQDLLEEVAQRLNFTSRRTVNRYLAVLDAPIAVQHAFENGQLSLVLAGQVARLPPEVQQEAASRISAGENPRNVVKELVDANGRTRLGYSPAFGPLIRRLTDLEKMIPESTEEITGHLNRESSLELLEQLVKKLTAVKRRVKANLRRDSKCESEVDCETKLLFDSVVAGQNGKEHSTDAPTTSVETPAKTSKRRAKKRQEPPSRYRHVVRPPGRKHSAAIVRRKSK